MEGHKWVAILDDEIEEIDEPGLRLRIPNPPKVGDRVFIRLNSGSADPRGNPRKEFRMYKLAGDNPHKTPPRFHLGVECRGYEVFHFADFNLYLYEHERPIPFFKLRNLLDADEVDVIEVFNEFDRQIYRLKKEDRLDNPDAESLYDKASKCKAKLFSTKYEAEAETCFKKAIRFLGQILGLSINSEGKPDPIFWEN